MPVQKWAFSVMRIFGAANLILAVAGFLLVASIVWRKLRLSLGSSVPYVEQFFWVMTIINLVFLSILVITGVRLCRRDVAAVRICNWLFGAEILYFFLIAAFWIMLPEPLAKGVAGASGGGDMGIAPQILTGYPVIAIIALNLAARRISSKRHPPESASS